MVKVKGMTMALGSWGFSGTGMTGSSLKGYTDMILETRKGKSILGGQDQCKQGLRCESAGGLFRDQNTDCFELVREGDWE